MNKDNQEHEHYGKTALSCRTLSFAPKFGAIWETEIVLKHMKRTVSIIMLIEEYGFRWDCHFYLTSITSRNIGQLKASIMVETLTARRGREEKRSAESFWKGMRLEELSSGYWVPPAWLTRKQSHSSTLGSVSECTVKLDVLPQSFSILSTLWKHRAWRRNRYPSINVRSFQKWKLELQWLKARTLSYASWIEILTLPPPSSVIFSTLCLL